MDHKPELPPHIDGSDFDNKWWAPGATGHENIPVRFEFKEVGRTRATPGEGKVELRLLGAYGAVSDSQTVALKRFKANGQEHFCLACQSCGRLSKRLFMVAALEKARPNRTTGAFAFTCRKCGGIDATGNRKSRRRPAAVRERSRRPRTAGRLNSPL
jgi:hypothetical protein